MLQTSLCLTLTFIAVLLFSSVLAKNSYSNEGEDDDDGVEVTEGDIDDILERYKDLGLTGSKMKELMLEPEKLLDKYSDMDVNTMLERLSNGDVNSLFDEHGSPSESLEFIINHRNRALGTERELDKLLNDKNIATRQREIVRQVVLKMKKLESLIERVEVLVAKANNKRLGKSEMRSGLKEVSEESKKLKKDFQSLEGNLTYFDDIEAFEKQKTKMHQEIEKFADMKYQYVKHTMNFRQVTGVELNSMDVSGIRGEGIKMNAEILETLLKKYQKLEGLKNNLLLEKDDEKKPILEKEITGLEKQIIPKYIDDNQEELSLFMPSTVAITVRSMKKLLNVDKLYTQLNDNMKETNELVQQFLQGLVKFHEVTEEAALLGMQMDEKRTEL